ncbi:substrate-binding domain-containing protein [Paenalcaligenes niemegkensis]|uniref:substrate-binding domain-containing protein n=1 Tax=Paenalcaligenes niemegkensis TaxID=2895469 RepID=UPI001EE8E4F8|nr:substrate-binding domain-containing protein [Paenalcaligenes niemegkensis]MCQ9617057.1 substrate-binding domain-containing protein [Paenalcaligenes niemegkensis]
MNKSFQLKMVSAALALGMMAAASAVTAQSVVVGGGATLPELLYKDGLLPSDFSYTGTGSGAGKKAFLDNNPQATEGRYFKNELAPEDVKPDWPASQSVHFAGSDSVLSQTELGAYVMSNQSSWGRLIQIPAVATSVTIPFNMPGTGNVKLSRDSMCKIFAGVALNWEDLPETERDDRTGALKPVYRLDSSGTTELFTRYLTNACADITIGSSTLKNNGKFSTVSDFKMLFVNNTVPATFVGADGSGGVVTQVTSTDGSIGYVSPDYTQADLNNGLKVAAVANASNIAEMPVTQKVIDALGTASAPEGSASFNPLAWVPTFDVLPTAGYPIVGYTNLLINQCYEDKTVEAKVKGFVTELTGTGKDVIIENHAFIPMPQDFKDAILATFVTGDSNNLDIGNCAPGVGRP